MTLLLTALRNAVARLDSDLLDSGLFKHRGDRGEFRERVLESFLRPFLPPCYGLGSGAVFSAAGAQSRQIDVVVYDAVFSNVLFRDQSNSLFPCEATFGLIEVKSDLDGAELEVALQNIASVKALPRAASDMLDLLPFRRLNVGGGLAYNTTRRNPYLGIVFAYRGLVAQTVVNTLNARLSEAPATARDSLPDFIFNRERGYMVFRARRDGQMLVPAPPGDSYDCFAFVTTGADTLPLFFFTINTCLNQLILRAPNFNDYWVNLVNAATRR